MSAPTPSNSTSSARGRGSAATRLPGCSVAAVSHRLGERAPAPERYFDPEQPTPGCYRVRLRRGAPDSAVRIWLGNSIDPVTGEEMSERPLLWQAELNGQRVPLEQVWPGCAKAPIDRAEHDRIVERNRTLDDTSPFYDPTRPIDIGRSAPVF